MRWSWRSRCFCSVRAQAMRRRSPLTRALPKVTAQTGGGWRGGRFQPASRLIIREAKVTVSVERIDEAADALGDLAADHGGRVQSSRIEGESGTVALRVPAERLDAVVDAVKALGVRVLSAETTSEDVTEEYVDLDAQVRNLQAAEDQFQVFMERATTVEDVLRVQSELTDVRGDIERLQGRIQFLQRNAAEALVTVSVRPATSQAALVDGGWSFMETAKAAVRGLTGTLQVLADIGTYVAIFAPLWLPAVGIALWLWRRSSRQWPETASQQAPPSP
jgi:hypothetical protein